jgi:hypothetical protein
VLEAYYVSTCDDYPLNRQLGFKGVTVFDEYLRPVVDPQWSVSVDSTDTPQCNYGVQAKPNEVTLDY